MEGPWDVVVDLMGAAASPTCSLAGFTVDEEEGAGAGAGAGAASRSACDLLVESAYLPQIMETGEWPADFDMSDHGPLTAVLVPKGR